MPWCPEPLPVAFTLAEAAGAAISRHRLNRAQRDGTLWRPTKGIYVDVVALRALTWPDRHRTLARAAALHLPASAISHVSAALMLGFPNPRLSQGPVHLTVTSRPRVNRSSDWVHLHRATLTADQLVRDDGIVITSAPRTVLDCCRKLRLGDAVAIADHALREGLVTVDELLAEFQGQFRWPGSARSRLALPLVDPRRENWFESTSAVALYSAGVPLATPQVEVLSDGGKFLGRVDFLWQDAGVIGEADGEGKLLGTIDDALDESPAAVSRRVIALGQRSTRLREAGFEVFHWVPRDLRSDGDPVVQRYRAARLSAQPGRVRARLRCACCKSDLSACKWRERITLPSTLSAGGA